MRLMLMCCLVLGAHPGASCAEAPKQLVETLASGHINWTQGVVQSQSADSLDKAIDNVLRTVVQVRLDDGSNVQDRVDASPRMWTEVKSMASASKVITSDPCLRGNSRITIQMDLFGGFAQLLLPKEIKQVESITPLNGEYASPDYSQGGVEAAIAVAPEVYSGLIVDARETGVKPAMVPVLVDEGGREVYSPAFVSREYAVQQGVCQYVRYTEGLKSLPRVAPKPLLVKGLRTAKNGRCNIVISNTDAAKLHGTSAHLSFLKQCRVVIVID